MKIVIENSHGNYVRTVGKRRKTRCHFRSNNMTDSFLDFLKNLIAEASECVMSG